MNELTINLTFFAIFAIGCFFVSAFFTTDDKNATKVVSILSGFLFAIITASILGHYFVLNDHGFEISYFEVRMNDPFLFEKYLLFVRVGALVGITIPIITRIITRSFQKKELFV